MVADALRRAHLHDGVPWSSMAVLVRSVIGQVPLLRRALAATGVPSVIAGDELPLEAEPGVRPLLLLLRCALHPDALDEEAAVELLAGLARRHGCPGAATAPPGTSCGRPRSR